MRRKIKLIMALNLISALTITAQAMDNQNSFDVASDFFQGTLLERVPRDVNGPMNKYMVPLTFKCPTVEELQTRGGVIDYKDDNGVVFILNTNKEIRDFLANDYSKKQMKYFDIFADFSNVQVYGREIRCSYIDNVFNSEQEITLDFAASGFNFDQVNYDPNLFDKMNDLYPEHEYKVLYLSSKDNRNVEFTVSFPPK